MVKKKTQIAVFSLDRLKRRLQEDELEQGLVL